MKILKSLLIIVFSFLVLFAFSSVILLACSNSLSRDFNILEGNGSSTFSVISDDVVKIDDKYYPIYSNWELYNSTSKIDTNIYSFNGKYYLGVDKSLFSGVSGYYEVDTEGNLLKYDKSLKTLYYVNEAETRVNVFKDDFPFYSRRYAIVFMSVGLFGLLALVSLGIIIACKSTEPV